jgi:Tfp pilus assembly protein PilO
MMFQGQIPTPPPPPPVPFDPNLLLTDVGAPLLVTIVGFSLLALTIILWPVMRALGRRLEGKGAADPALRAEVDQLRQRVAEVDALHHRVAELEERIDFTERMLARARSPAALPGDVTR